MKQVDFYVIENADQRAHDVFFCRLVTKAWRQGHRIHVQLRDEPHALRFDDLLWTFHDTGFIPHAVCRAGVLPEAVPVSIGYEADAPAEPDVLVNLGGAMVPDPGQFVRIVESAGFDADTRSAARARFRHWQTLGVTPATLKVSA